MNSKISVLGLLTVLAFAMPTAQASAASKKISLDCSAGSGDEITVSAATVTLCAGFDGVNCTGDSVTCSPLACDSSGISAPISVSDSCRTKFKPQGFQLTETGTDSLDGDISLPYPARVLQAHGVTIQIIGNMDPDFAELSIR